MKFVLKSALNRTTYLHSAAVLAAAIGLAASSSALAQDAAPADCVDANNNNVCDSEEQSSGGIVVTGSRIARPTLESPVPLTSVSTDELVN